MAPILFLGDKVKSWSMIQGRLRVESLHLHINRANCGGLVLDTSLRRNFGHIQEGEGPGGADSGHAGEIISLGWPENALVFPQKSWRRWLEKRRSGRFCLGYCPRNPNLDKQKLIDGWEKDKILNKEINKTIVKTHNSSDVIIQWKV